MSTFGRYVLEQELGRGAMGVVYRGRDTVLERPVALKFLEPAGGAITAEQQERFRREARVAASLRHPNVVTIYELLEEGGRMAIVMELVDGTPLDTVLDRERCLPLATARSLAIQLLEGLAAAHGTGLVHRDIKPANLLLERDGRLKIVDFGIAKLPHEALTAHGVMFGTLGYVAPELYRGQSADQRSDLFAVGCLVYEMVTGRAAFGGGTLAAITHSTLNTDPPFDSEEWVTDPALAGLTAALLRKDPATRPASARDALLLLHGAEAAGLALLDGSTPPATPTQVVIGATVPFGAGEASVAPGSGTASTVGSHMSATVRTSATSADALPLASTTGRPPLLLAGGLVLSLVTVIGLAWMLWSEPASTRVASREGVSAAADVAGLRSPDQPSVAGDSGLTDAPNAPSDSTGPTTSRSGTELGGSSTPGPSAMRGASRSDPSSDSADDTGDEVTVEPISLMLGVGEQARLRLSGPAGGSRSWTSSNPGVARVDGQGLVDAAGVGEAIITVRSGGIEREVPVTVHGDPGRARAAPLSSAQLDSMVVAAVRSGDVKALESALTRGGSANARTPDGTPVLVAAARSGRTDLVRWLQMCGAPTKGSVVEQASGQASDAIRQQLADATTSGVGVQNCGERVRKR